MAGATQHKAPCPHIADRRSGVCFHSEVSAANVGKWESIRLPDDVDSGDLRTLLDVVDDDATVAICNSCRRINKLLSGDVEVLHSGDPHFDDRVGSWQIDLEDASTSTPGLRGQS
jgi:hypothetical protein